MGQGWAILRHKQGSYSGVGLGNIETQTGFIQWGRAILRHIQGSYSGVGPIPLVPCMVKNLLKMGMNIGQNGAHTHILVRLVESTNEENKKPESPKKVETSPPPFSIPDTGLISCDWEPSMLDPGRGMFTFGKDNTPPKRADCKQQ